jgi:class 3 adenylate cyclase/uncharacterized membrane protein (UPF0127 family)
MPKQRPAPNTAIIFFADIVDSTALNERMGDAAFRALARRLDGLLRERIRSCAGRPIEGKLLGDGVLAVFESAQSAIDCALRCAAEGSALGLPLHLGLHAGDVIREDNNVFGGAVNIAARIAAASAPSEVLVSDTVRGLARTSTNVVFDDAGAQELKGVRDEVRLYRVRRQRGANVSLDAPAPGPRAPQRSMRAITAVSLAVMIASAAAIALLAWQPWSEGEPHRFARTTLRADGSVLTLDVARTSEEQRDLRLRDRSMLSGDQGMLYDGVGASRQWDTAAYGFPIDLIWVDAAKSVIAVIDNVPPGTAAGGEVDLSVPDGARYAIETAAGAAASLGMAPGAQLTFYPATTIKLAGREINAEVACTVDEQLMIGLGRREALAADSALLYDWQIVLDEQGERVRSWSTRDYLFPIDIIWLDDARTVIDVTAGVAPDTTGIPQPVDMHYAIEVNAGAAADWSVVPGARFQFDVPCDA